MREAERSGFATKEGAGRARATAAATPPPPPWDPGRVRVRTPGHERLAISDDDCPQEAGEKRVAGDSGRALVRTVLAEARRLGITDKTLGRAAGIHWRTVENWRDGQQPRLAPFMRALEAVGLRIVLRRR